MTEHFPQVTGAANAPAIALGCGDDGCMAVDAGVEAAVKAKVETLTARFPMYAYLG